MLEIQLEVVSKREQGNAKIEAPVLLPISIAEGDEEQLYPADESLFVSDIQSVVVYSTAFGRTTTIGPSAHLVSPDTLVTECNNLKIDDTLSVLYARNNLINDGYHYNLLHLDKNICNALASAFDEMVQAFYDNKKKIVEMAHGGALFALQKIIIDIGVHAATEWEHYAQYESLVLKYFNNSLGAPPGLLLSTRFEDACTTYQPFYNLLSHRNTLFDEYPSYVQVSPHFV